MNSRARFADAVPRLRQGMLVALAAAALLFGPSIPSKAAADPAFDAWLKASALGPHQPKEEDWNQIVEKAKAEGEVVIYASAGILKDVAESFMKAYPGIKVTVFKLGSEKTVEKIVREHDANLFNADIVTTGGTEEMVYALLDKNRIVNYVPRYLTSRIPEDLREPLLVRVLEAQTFFYNSDIFAKAPPVKNVWELTEPKWRGKLGMKDVAQSLTTFEAVAAVIEHANDLAAAYKRYTGKPLELTNGNPNAGYEFLYRFIRNDVVLFKSSSKLVQATGVKGSNHPFVGLSVMHYLGRNASEGMVNAVFTGLDPFSTLVYPTYTAIAARAPHPNAAKLMTAFMMGSEALNLDSKLKPPFNEGESSKLLQGLAAEYRVGIVSPRDDVPPPPGGEVWKELPKWKASAATIHREGARLRDFWIKAISY